jgi:hypothetical protein
MFPQVRGQNLNRQIYTLPRDLEGDVNLVILAFWQRQQRSVDTWMPFAEKFSAEHPGFRVYELPVLDRMMIPFRFVIDGGMRSGIPDSGVRGRTITLYLNKANFLRSLQIRDQDTIHGLLVTQQGQILWRSDGDYSEEKGEGLKAAIEAHLPPSSP